MNLRPILENELDSILLYLKDWEKMSYGQNVQHISLLSGLPGIILVLIDLLKNGSDKISIEKIREYIFSTFTILENSNNFYTTYCAGLSGYGYFLLKVKDSNIFIAGTDDETLMQIEEILEEIDEVLVDQIDIDFADENFDILHGVIGIGLYFLERDKKVLAYKIVDKLDEISNKTENYVFWKKYEKYRLFTTVIDMGNAHGNSSIIYFLSKIFSKNPEDVRLKELIQKSINFYLQNSQKLDENVLSYFPNHINASDFDNNLHKPENSRLAWCYGDLGVLHTLLLSASLIKDMISYNNIMLKLEKVAQRRFETEPIPADFGFCHGSSGIAAIFNNIYHMTGNDIFLSTSEYWLANTVERKEDHPETVVGYSFLNEKSYVSDLSLLEGLSGILFSYSKYLYGKMPISEETLFLKT